MKRIVFSIPSINTPKMIQSINWGEKKILKIAYVYCRLQKTFLSQEEEGTMPELYIILNE